MLHGYHLDLHCEWQIYRVARLLMGRGGVTGCFLGHHACTVQ